MLHLRVIAPYERTDRVVEALDRTPGVTNIVVLTKAARRPEGDMVLADVAREAANTVIEELKALGLEEDGSITAEEIELSISRGADEAEERAPGEGEDAVVWDQFEARVALDSRITWAFLTFLTIATQLAAIGVVIPSQILIVGAMVLGPEFGAVAAVSFGLLGRHWRLIGAAARTLTVGFAVAVAVTLACALAARGLHWISPRRCGTTTRCASS